jgi:hypothetical protein
LLAGTKGLLLAFNITMLCVCAFLALVTGFTICLKAAGQMETEDKPSETEDKP